MKAFYFLSRRFKILICKVGLGRQRVAAYAKTFVANKANTLDMEIEGRLLTKKNIVQTRSKRSYSSGRFKMSIFKVGVDRPGVAAYAKTSVAYRASI